MDCSKIWNELQDSIRTAVSSEVSYTVHIKPAEAVLFEDSVFIISVPSSINRNMIEFRFKNKIESILEAHTGQKREIQNIHLLMKSIHLRILLSVLQMNTQHQQQ